MGRCSLSLIRAGDGRKSDSSKPDLTLFGGDAPKISTAGGVALRRIVISGSLIGMLSSSHSQTPADDAAIRSQGYQCDQPVTATQNVRLSKPDSLVWTLKCHNATYRVRLVPDMTAHVVRLRKQSH
jgi:hypothetical protein